MQKNSNNYEMQTRWFHFNWICFVWNFFLHFSRDFVVETTAIVADAIDDKKSKKKTKSQKQTNCWRNENCEQQTQQKNAKHRQKILHQTMICFCFIECKIEKNIVEMMIKCIMHWVHIISKIDFLQLNEKKLIWNNFQFLYEKHCMLRNVKKFSTKKKIKKFSIDEKISFKSIFTIFATTFSIYSFQLQYSFQYHFQFFLSIDATINAIDVFFNILLIVSYIVVLNVFTVLIVYVSAVYVSVHRNNNF